MKAFLVEARRPSLYSMTQEEVTDRVARIKRLTRRAARISFERNMAMEGGDLQRGKERFLRWEFKWGGGAEEEAMEPVRVERGRRVLTREGIEGRETKWMVYALAGRLENKEGRAAHEEIVKFIQEQKGRLGEETIDYIQHWAWDLVSYRYYKRYLREDLYEQVKEGVKRGPISEAFGRDPLLAGAITTISLRNFNVVMGGFRDASRRVEQIRKRVGRERSTKKRK
jgi:hypothetical protein